MIHAKLKQHGGMKIAAQNQEKSEWTICAAFSLRLADREQCVAIGLGTRVVGEATLQKLRFGGPLSGKFEHLL